MPAIGRLWPSDDYDDGDDDDVNLRHDGDAVNGDAVNGDDVNDDNDVD